MRGEKQLSRLRSGVRSVLERELRLLRVLLAEAGDLDAVAGCILVDVSPHNLSRLVASAVLFPSHSVTSYVVWLWCA